MTSTLTERSQTVHLTCEFFSATHAAQLLSTLGFKWNIIQLNKGPLRGCFHLKRCGSIVLMSVQANRELLFQGNRNSAFIPIGLEFNNQSDNYRVRGEAIKPLSIYGFHLDYSDIFFKSPGGCHFSFALFPRHRLQHIHEHKSNGQLMEKFETTNSLELEFNSYTALAKLMAFVPNQQSCGTNGDLHGELLEAQLIDCCTSISTQNLHPLPPSSSRIGLMQDLLRWGFKNSSQPISLNDLATTILASRTTICEASRELFGVGPMTLLKQIRLQQVQAVLRDVDLQQQINCFTVMKISNYYGFQSRNHFANDYRKQFGETPRETLNRGTGNRMH